MNVPALPGECSTDEPMSRQTPGTVLIIAASANLRDGLHSLLSLNARIGCVSHASDGLSAMQIIEKGCPDLVLLDFDLAYEDAQKVLTSIKGRCPGTPCLALTDRAEKREEICSAGADAVLLKGHPAASLALVIAELLG